MLNPGVLLLIGMVGLTAWTLIAEKYARKKYRARGKLKVIQGGKAYRRGRP